VNISWADAERGRGPTGVAIRTGQHVIARNIPTDPAFAPWRAAAIQRGYASSIALPLVKEGQKLGALMAYAAEADAFDADEVTLLAELADNLAYGLKALRGRQARALAEEGLRESEARFRRLFEASPDALFLLDNAGRLLDCNQTAEARYGYRREELLQMTVRELAVPDLRDQAVDRLKRALETGGAFEWRHRRKDGTELPVEISTKPFLLGGRPCVLSSVRDITARKRAEETLREAQDRMAKTVATTPGIVCSFRFRPDGSACFPFGGERLAEVYGIPSADLEEDAAPFFALVHPDDLGGLRETIAESARRQSAFRHEWRVRHPVHGELWIEAHSMPLHEPDGSTLWHGVAADITARKRTEAELTAALELSRQVFHSTPLPTVLSRLPEKTIVDANEAFALKIGYACAEVIGRPLSEFDWWADSSEREAVVTALIANGKVSGHEFIYKTKSGQTGTGLFYAETFFQRGERYVLAKMLDITDRKQAEAARHESDRRVREVLASITSGYQIIDRHGRYAGFNDATRKMITTGGRDPDALLGQHVLEAFPETRDLAGTQALFRTLTERVPTEAENFYEAWHRWFAVRNYPTPDGGVAMFFDDITERKQAEVALQESEERLRLSVEAAAVGLWDWDLQINKVYYSPEWKHQIGYRDDEISDDFSEWQSRVHPDDLEPALQKVRAFVANPVGRHEAEFRFRHKDGSYRSIYTHADVLRDATGHPVRMLGCHIDITERKRAETAVRELAAELQSAREGERLRIAREIHDVLAQELTRLQLDIAMLRRQLMKPLDEAQRQRLLKRTELMKGLTADAIRTVQKIATELRPVVLDSLGLCAAIEWLAEDFQARTGIPCAASVPGEAIAANLELETELFRIVQESLTNVARHARAKRVEIVLAEEGGDLVLTVRDNGCGMDNRKLNDPHSLGLTGIRERALSLRGAARFESAPGEGTTVRVRVPMASDGCRVAGDE
jgi:PAS domain S-box-containing protein